MAKIEIRLSDGEKASLRKLSDNEKLALSTWARVTLLRIAEKASAQNGR